MKISAKQYREFYIGCIRLYGVIDSDSAFDIFKTYYPNSIKDEFLDDLRKRLSRNSREYTIWTTKKKNIYLIADEGLDDRGIGKLFSLQDNKPFYIPSSLDTFLKSSSYEYWEEVNKEDINKLIAILKKCNCPVSELIITLIYPFLQISSLSEKYNPFNTLLDVFKRMNVNFDEESFTNLLPIIQSLSNNTKLPCNRGFTPLELKQYYLDNKDIPNC